MHLCDNQPKQLIWSKELDYLLTYWSFALLCLFMTFRIQYIALPFFVFFLRRKMTSLWSTRARSWTEKSFGSITWPPSSDVIMSAPTSPPTSPRNKSKLMECKVLQLDDNIVTFQVPVSYAAVDVVWNVLDGKRQGCSNWGPWATFGPLGHRNWPAAEHSQNNTHKKSLHDLRYNSCKERKQSINLKFC